MKKNQSIILFALSALALGSAQASEPLSFGKVKSLSYRGGYMTFMVMADDGTNYCNSCPGDPGGLGTKRCWIEETKQAQVSMLLMAKAQDHKIGGRVIDFAADCSVYQMTLAD